MSDILVDHLRLDLENEEFAQAAEWVRTMTTGVLYLTGKAGSGKTTFLKYIRRSLPEKTMIVVAPTGVAAVNAGGVTMHSFFKIPFGPLPPDDERFQGNNIYANFAYSREKRNIIENLDVLIIDEISMVRADTIDLISKLLSVYRKDERPFGGIQTLMIGDTFQLPPVTISNEWSLLETYYSSPYFFSSHVIKRCIKQTSLMYIELKKIYRQTEVDFINLLNRVRINRLSEEDLDLLNSRVVQSLSNTLHQITLTTHNNLAEVINSKMLLRLEGPDIRLVAQISGTFGEKMHPTLPELIFKQGCQVMVLKNDFAKRIYNGKIGLLSEYDADRDRVLLSFSDGSSAWVEQVTWENVQYVWNDDEKRLESKVIGTFRQFPLRLAWAITVHKSQGLTFENVVADLGGAFAEGQVYVALSRCTSLNGLTLLSRIERSAIRVNPTVMEFALHETPATLVAEVLTAGKADSMYKSARQALWEGAFGEAFDRVVQAFRQRNDLTLPIFKRYIVTYLERRNNHILRRDIEYKSQMGQLKTLNNELYTQNSKLQKAVENYNIILSAHDNLKVQIKNLMLDLEAQSRVSSSTLQRLEETNKQLNHYKELLVSEASSLEALQAKIDILEMRIRDMLIERDHFSKKIHELEKDNEKLRLRTLWDFIWGSK